MESKQPPRIEFPELPIKVLSDWCSVSKVTHALDELERGMFDQASLLVDAMGRDDRIKGVLSTRVQGLLGLPRSFSGGGTSLGEKAAQLLGSQWDSMFPHAQLSDLIAWGLMVGLGVGELVWDLESSEWWIPRLKVWHPQFVYWRWDTRSYWLITEQDAIEIHPGDGKWVLFAPWGLNRAWLGGLVRSLARPWLIRQWAYRDWARYSELQGFPIVKAIVPADASEEDKQKFFQGVANRGGEASVEVPRRAEGDSYDVDLLEVTPTSHLGFQHLIERTESSIAVAILGQNLTTEVQGGSFAAASVHDRVRRDFLEADAEIVASTLRQQVFTPWANFNFGEGAVPSVEFETEPPEDTAESTKALLSLASAVEAFQRAGAPVDMEALLTHFKIPIAKTRTQLTSRRSSIVFGDPMPIPMGPPSHTHK